MFLKKKKNSCLSLHIFHPSVPPTSARHNNTCAAEFCSRNGADSCTSHSISATRGILCVFPQDGHKAGAPTLFTGLPQWLMGNLIQEQDA